MGLTIIWILIILFLSIIPTGNSLTGEPSANIIDYVIHSLMYGILVILFIRVLKLKISLTKATVLSISFVSVYGFAIELLQYALPWREFSLSDELANVVGAFCFGIIYALKEHYRKSS
jgi:VanZ family protein